MAASAHSWGGFLVPRTDRTTVRVSVLAAGYVLRALRPKPAFGPLLMEPELL